MKSKEMRAWLSSDVALPLTVRAEIHDELIRLWAIERALEDLIEHDKRDRFARAEAREVISHG